MALCPDLCKHFPDEQISSVINLETEKEVI